MTMKYRDRIKFLTIAGVSILAAVFTILPSSPARAETINNSLNTLKVSPVRSDITIEAGKEGTAPVTITNLTSTSVTLRLVENDFIAGDERGTPALILDVDKYAPTHSLKRFMKPVSDIIVPAGQSKTVDVMISVPKDAKAGGYFGAVRFAPTNPEGGAQVNLSTSVASLILLTVPGPTTEKLDLTDFQVQQNGSNGTIFRTPDNLQLTFRFASSSNIQVAPMGKISVKKGDKVIYQTDFNQKDPKDMILPDSARRWDVPLQNIEGFFGKYTVQATLAYGKSNQTVEVKKDFWIISWAAIAIAGGALLLLVILVVVIILLIRRRKRRAPRRAKFGGGNSGGYRR